MNHCRVLDIALATVAEAVIATDSADLITYLNPAAEALLGWAETEAVGRPLRAVLCLTDSRTDRVIDDPLQWVKLSAGSSAGHLDATLVNRRGLHVGVEFRIVALRGEKGVYGGGVIVCQTRRLPADIALQVRDESLLADADALFEEKERAQVTLNSIGDAVISANFSGRVSYLNVVAETMTGWTQADAAGRAVDDILHLVDAVTHESIPCPSVVAIIENRKVSLETPCVLIRPDGQETAVEVSATPIHDREGGVVGVVMVAHDVTAARELSKKLARLALHDNLTDLPNRTLFAERLRYAMTDALERGVHIAVLYIDLDRFKHINDSLGHAIGDKLLKTVAQRLLGCVRNSDTVSRQGGDEFVVVLAQIERASDGAACAEKILAALEAPYRIGDHELKLSASIGIAIFPTDATDGEGLLKCADVAMYQAKYHGRNNYKWFTAGSELDAL